MLFYTDDHARKTWGKGSQCFNYLSMLRREHNPNLDDDIGIPYNLVTNLLVNTSHILKFEWPTLLLLSSGCHALQSNKFGENEYYCFSRLRINRRCPILSDESIPSQTDDGHSPYLHTTIQINCLYTLTVTMRFRGENFQVSSESRSISSAFVGNCHIILFITTQLRLEGKKWSPIKEAPDLCTNSPC